MDDPYSLPNTNSNLPSGKPQDVKVENLKGKKVKTLFIYVFVSIFIFFLGVFGFWFYQKFISSKNVAHLPEPSNILPSKKAQPTPSFKHITKTELKTNDFLYNQNGQLWLGKTNASGEKPIFQKLTDKITNYVVSHSKDKIAYIDGSYLKLQNIANYKEVTLQKLVPDNYPQEIPEPDYIRAIGNIAWSADDSKLAFVGSRDFQADIYIIDSDGKNLKRLTNDKLNEFSLAWSPDDKKLAFQTTKGFGTGAGNLSNIAIIDSDTNNYSQIISNGKLPDNHGFGPAENLRWINNNEIIFSAWTVAGPDGIWKANVKSKQILALTDKRGFSTAVWSEKNRAFLYPLKEKNFLIVKVNGESKVIETDDRVVKVVWSHDGSKIAYSVEHNPNKPVTKPKELTSDLFVANLYGNELSKIISNAKFLFENFSFSSDNKMLLYTKRLFNPQMHTGLWLINYDGSNNRQIDSSSDIYGLTAPYGNLAIYSKASPTAQNQQIHYWLNLNTLAKEAIMGNKRISGFDFFSK